MYSDAHICTGIPPLSYVLFKVYDMAPKRVLAGGLHINGVKVHESHRLASTHGVLFGTKCGCYTVKIVRELNGVIKK